MMMMMILDVLTNKDLSAAKHRNIFFSNVKKLIEVTRGDNIIFSSEALQALEVRSTNDLKML